MSVAFWATVVICARSNSVQDEVVAQLRCCLTAPQQSVKGDYNSVGRTLTKQCFRQSSSKSLTHCNRWIGLTKFWLRFCWVTKKLATMTLVPVPLRRRGFDTPGSSSRFSGTMGSLSAIWAVCCSSLLCSWHYWRRQQQLMQRSVMTSQQITWTSWMNSRTQVHHHWAHHFCEGGCELQACLRQLRSSPAVRLQALLKNTQFRYTNVQFCSTQLCCP